MHLATLPMASTHLTQAAAGKHDMGGSGTVFLMLFKFLLRFMTALIQCGHKLSKNSKIRGKPYLSWASRNASNGFNTSHTRIRGKAWLGSGLVQFS